MKIFDRELPLSCLTGAGNYLSGAVCATGLHLVYCDSVEWTYGCHILWSSLNVLLFMASWVRYKHAAEFLFPAIKSSVVTPLKRYKRTDGGVSDATNNITTWGVLTPWMWNLKTKEPVLPKQVSLSNIKTAKSKIKQFSNFTVMEPMLVFGPHSLPTAACVCVLAQP